VDFMSLWETVTWDIARAGGFTAYILLGLSVAMGLALSMKWQSPSKWPRIINNELHNFLALLALVFTTVHVLAVWIDPYTKFGWNEVFIPFLTHYRTIWMSLGIVALYLGIAIGISTLLRPYIGYTWWRRLHYVTIAIYILVTIHGIMTGSDTKTTWGLGIYGGSIAVIGLLLTRRIVLSMKARNQKRAVPVANAKRQSGEIAAAMNTQQPQTYVRPVTRDAQQAYQNARNRAYDSRR
jgi:predicted ferric reductase